MTSRFVRIRDHNGKIMCYALKSIVKCYKLPKGWKCIPDVANGVCSEEMKEVSAESFHESCRLGVFIDLNKLKTEGDS